jgi:hypothetical protein
VRFIVPAVALLAVAAAVAPAASSSQAVTRPQLRLTATSPIVVRGSGFHAGERVRLVVRAPALVIRRVTAGTGGAFTMRVNAFAGDVCAGLSVTATGDHGSRATYRRLPQQCGAIP